MRIAENPILERVTLPALEGLSQESARAILRMKLSNADIERIHELSAQAKAGSIDSAERSELNLYLNIAHMLTFLHSKARQAIRSPGPRKRRRIA